MNIIMISLMIAYLKLWKFARSKMNATKQEYMSVIFSGCSIDHKGVMICNLANHYPRLARSNEYQVWSDRTGEHYLFKNIEDAVDKFIELKKGK